MAFNALMPGEHDWMKNARMSSSATPGYTPPQDDFASLMVSLGGSPSRAPKPAPAQAPQKKNRPILNALGTYLQFAAPEQYEAGRTARMNRDYQNALAGGDMEKAAQYRLQMGDFEGAKQIQDYTAGQSAEARKQEAQGVYQLFTSMQPAQINDYAMQDPAGFERMTGMTSEEYLASAQQMQQVGMTPEQFHQYVIGKAQAELGMESKPTEYGLDLIPVQGADGKIQYVQASKAGGVRPVEGYQPVPETPDLPEGMRLTADGQYEWIPGYLEAQEKLRRAGASSTNITLPGEKGENKFQEGLGTQAATNFQTIVDQGRAASAAIGNLDTMETLLDSIDYTGFGGDTLLQVQRAGAMLGFEIPDLPAKEAAKRLSSQMALALKTDLPGPMSNADREFLLSIPPNLNSTQAGNDAILFILRKREERKQDMMRSLLQADPRSMEEYRAWENQYLQSTPPMFSAATQASLLRALAGASGADSPQ